MPDTRDLLLESADRLLRHHCDRTVLARAEAGDWPDGLWRAVEQAGFPAALVPEAAGGSGLATADGLALLRASGRFCAPVPLGESMLAMWLLAKAGLGSTATRLTIAPVTSHERFVLERQGQGWRLSGRASRVPWGRNAHEIVVLASRDAVPMVVRLRSDGAVCTPGKNLAGEPRDTLDVDATVASDAVANAPEGFDLDQLLAFGAAMRTIQIAGALEHVLAITVRYAQDRVQFGRPIGKFQAVQQNLAVLAVQTAAAGAAADMAAEAVEKDLSPFVIGAAKARAGESASVAAAIAHQVHGAIGFTQEHLLNYSTRRLWSWRDEFGSEAYWSRLVGELAAKVGGHGLWPAITAAA